MFHTVCDMLSTNDFVYVLALDFSKAFDSVRHATLMDKMALLTLPDEVYNWIRDFFCSHSHCTKFVGEVSSLVDITASVIQGSSLGPASYIVNAADLHPRHAANHMMKFADDIYLIIPALNSRTRDDELIHVKSWAAPSNLQLNAPSHTKLFFVHADSEEKQSNRHRRVLTSSASTN